MVPFAVDVLGHIGYFSIAVGMYLVTLKNLWGFAFRFVGEVIWLVIGLLLGMSSLLIWGVIFMGIDIYGFVKWRRENAEASE